MVLLYEHHENIWKPSIVKVCEGYHMLSYWSFKIYWWKLVVVMRFTCCSGCMFVGYWWFCRMIVFCLRVKVMDYGCYQMLRLSKDTNTTTCSMNWTSLGWSTLDVETPTDTVSWLYSWRIQCIRIAFPFDHPDHTRVPMDGIDKQKRLFF